MCYDLMWLSITFLTFRLDFQPTTTLPLATLPDGQCGDTGAELRVGSGFSNNAAAFPPVICGQLTGQHLYFESGSTGNAGSLAISLGTTPGPRQYNIKVSYIPCDSPLSFSVAESAIVTPDPFDVSNANMIQDNCMKLSHVLIPSSVMIHDNDRMVIVIPSMRCGQNFGSVSGPDQRVPSSLPSLPNVPFAIGVRTLPAMLVGGVTGLGGFSLDYTQVPC
ncbi:hypothetical protein TCAL_09566 [Tigriopus californicus]|uniref:CUB domain-containing protein n=1 Tax=Tigriopus californicus TaxID=6832 RepID=A0A553PTE6_TIGCA|nr:hypothetical protein TCAL_09566 [Tigriopus californicus]